MVKKLIFCIFVTIIKLIPGPIIWKFIPRSKDDSWIM